MTPIMLIPDLATGQPKAVPYAAPKFPARPFIIEEKETGAVILICPGATREQFETGRDGKKGAKIGETKGYAALKPMDRGHATRMTEAGAIAFARKHFSESTHRIIKAI